VIFLLAASSPLSATTTAASILLYRCVRNMGSAQSTSCKKLSVSCAVKTGDPFVDPKLEELRNETITVLKIGHYRELCDKEPSIILHDFVGFFVRLEDGVTFRIKAEKSDSGISVTQQLLRWGKDVKTKFECEKLEDCGKIRMEDLLAILKEPSHDYHLLNDNCWSYADASFKQVIRKFLETPSLTPDRRSYLASFLNNPPPVMPENVIFSCSFKVFQFLTSQGFWLICCCLHRQWEAEVGAYALLELNSMYPNLIWVAPGLLVYIFGGLLAFCALYEFVTFVMDGISIRQAIKDGWRSLRFRRPCMRSLFSRRPLNQAQGLPPM
jgi:hypothetical protein